jgi:hypothetical protein
MPAPSHSYAGTASQLIPGVLRTRWQGSSALTAVYIASILNG